jgi:hypothetical protein
MASKAPGPAPADIGAAFSATMEDRACVDREADPVDVGGFSLVCVCGKDWAHAGRCARCAVRNGNLFCGLANNHRGKHQAIAVWG